jgi:sirohydrochlorin ferrochelatase
MAVEDDRQPDSNPTSHLESREPTLDDLRDLCRALNERGARYVVIGGFAIRAAGYIRRTMDVDLIVAADLDNESRVFDALATLPDQAVRELQPGELEQYTVIRVADEILVDLMRSAGGIDYAEAARDVVVREVDGVPIPFASPRLLWRMKSVTHREKDAGDLVFLRYWFAERGETPPTT